MADELESVTMQPEMAAEPLQENARDLTQTADAHAAAAESTQRERDVLTSDRQEEQQRGSNALLYTALIVTALVLIGIFVSSLSRGVGQTQSAPAVVINRPAPPPPASSLPTPVQLGPNGTQAPVTTAGATGAAEPAPALPAAPTATPVAETPPPATVAPPPAPTTGILPAVSPATGTPINAVPNASATTTAPPVTTPAPAINSAPAGQ